MRCSLAPEKGGRGRCKPSASAGRCPSTEEPDLSAQDSTMSTILDVSRDADLAEALLDVREGFPVPAADPRRSVYLIAKAVLDFTLAAVLLVLTGPVILLCALLVR